MSPIGIAETVAGVGAAGSIAAYWFLIISDGAKRELAERHEHVRADRAYYAAIEAAEDDPSFAPDLVKQSMVRVPALANRVWRGQTVASLDGRPDGPLISAWARSRQSWLGSGLRLRGNPAIDLIGVVNRPGEAEDRIVARVRVRLRRGDARLGLLAVRRVRLDERWTLGKYGGEWALLSIEGDPRAGPVLTAPLIPTPAHDTERLREESFAELGSAQTAPDDVLSELISDDEPPAFAMLDLSVVDGRFLPELVATHLAHLVEAWEDAVTGSDAPLHALVSDSALTALLRPAAGRRLIIRDAVMKSWEPTRLELRERPPQIHVCVEVEAVRYLVTDEGTQCAGNSTERRQIVLIWTLELTDETRTPWRLVNSNNPAHGIPNWSPS